MQILKTSQAFSKRLGDNFVLGASCVDPANNLYTGRLVNFGQHNGLVLGWKQMSWIKRNNISIVYGREWALLWFMMLLNKYFFRLPLRFVFESHHIPKDFRLQPVLRQCEQVFCVTEGLRDDLLKQFPFIKKITVTRNGVDLDEGSACSTTELREKYQLPLTARIVTYVGSVGVHRWKGEDVFLRSRDFVFGPEFHFLIVGVREGDLEEFKAKWGDERTTIFGRKTSHEVAEIEQLSNVLVLPNTIKDIESERYTSPIKMFSYMRSGRPIVATNIPSIREVLAEESAYIVPPGDPKALADAIVDAVVDRAESDKKAAAASILVREFTWNRKVEKIIDNLSLIS